MTSTLVQEALPVDTERLEAAARVLEQALKVGPPDPQAAYLLAVVYKRLGKLSEARTAFRKIGGALSKVSGALSQLV